METLHIESLDQEGRGIARRDGKTIFVEGALPGETVACTPYRRKPSYEVATLDAVILLETVKTVLLGRGAR